jgi:hypothetical protein
VTINKKPQIKPIIAPAHPNFRSAQIDAIVPMVTLTIKKSNSIAVNLTLPVFASFPDEF